MRRITLKDRDNFNEMLNQYQVPPGKESDISMTILLGQEMMSRMVRSKTPFSILLKDQARYISPYLWGTQIVAIIAIILLFTNLTVPHFEIQKILFSVTPILAFFGIEGSKSFVQNWAVNPSPYAFTYLTSYLAVTAMSFVGLLFLTSMILFISSRSKTAFISLIISAIITLLPTAHLDIFASRIVQKILMFLPTNILIGVNHFKTFEAFYLFGNHCKE
jgi:hypothetical protein